MRHTRNLIFNAFLLLLFLIGGCDSKSTFREYRTRKKNASHTKFFHPKTLKRHANTHLQTHFQWKKPGRWKQLARRFYFELANFAIPSPHGQARCSVVLLKKGGTLLSNINRWRAQMSLAPLTKQNLSKGVKPMQIASFPGNFVDIKGMYRGMGKKGIKNYRLLGAIAHTSFGWLFIKMVGAEKGVSKEYTTFLSFCRSFKRKK